MTGEPTVRFLDELASELRGPRRARRRLRSELADHLRDAIGAERAAGLSPEEAEAAALERIGSADRIAERWNDDRRAGRKGRRVVAIAVAAAASVALGMTQLASGKSVPSRPAGPQNHVAPCAQEAPPARPGQWMCRSMPR